VSLAARVKHELKEVGLVTLYFLFCFGIILTLKKLFLAEYQIKFYALSGAVISALIAGKIVVVLDKTRAGTRFDRSCGIALRRAATQDRKRHQHPPAPLDPPLAPVTMPSLPGLRRRSPRSSTPQARKKSMRSSPDLRCITPTTRPLRAQHDAHFLVGLPSRRPSDRLPQLDVARHDAQLAVLVSGIGAAHEEDFVSAQQENVHGHREPRMRDLRLRRHDPA
jgi:hypothetical protein